MAETKEDPKPEEKEETSEEESTEPTLEELLTEAAALEQAPTAETGEEKPEEKAKEEETQEEKEEEKAPPPSVDLSSPEVQESLRGLFSQWVQREQAQASADEKSAHVAKLVEEGDTDELGRLFTEEFRRGKDRSVIEREVLTNFLGGYYTRIFQHPALQDLTTEEKTELDPRKAASDMDYMFTLMEFVRTKEFGTKAEGLVEERVKARIEAIKKGEVPGRTKKAAESGVPSGSPKKGDVPDSDKSGAELLSEGMNEMLSDYVT